jgi:hypothetical protein
MGLSVFEASGILLLVFTIGAAANATRAMLMRMSGSCYVVHDRFRVSLATRPAVAVSAINHGSGFGDAELKLVIIPQVSVL